MSNNKNTNLQIQNQIQIQKQDITQAQNQAFSNEILCRLLSSAECYHHRNFENKIKKKKMGEIFSYYNTLNSGNEKSIEHLKKQLLNQFEIFKSSFENYREEYEEYNFPDNLDPEFIKYLLKDWKEDFEKDNKLKEDAKYYEGIIKLIDGNEKISFRQDIKQLNKNKKNKNGAVAKKLMESIGAVQDVASNIELKVKNDIEQKGYYKHEVQLDKKYSDNEDMKRVKDEIKRNRELINKELNDENDEENNDKNKEIKDDKNKKKIDKKEEDNKEDDESHNEQSEKEKEKKEKEKEKEKKEKEKEKKEKEKEKEKKEKEKEKKEKEKEKEKKEKEKEKKEKEKEKKEKEKEKEKNKKEIDDLLNSINNKIYKEGAKKMKKGMKNEIEKEIESLGKRISEYQKKNNDKYTLPKKNIVKDLNARAIYFQQEGNELLKLFENELKNNNVID